MPSQQRPSSPTFADMLMRTRSGVRRMSRTKVGEMTLLASLRQGRARPAERPCPPSSYLPTVVNRPGFKAHVVSNRCDMASRTVSVKVHCLIA